MVMSNKGNLTPNPRQQFITDMTPLFIQDQQTLGREILLMMDANEETSPTNRGIVNLFHDFSLLNLMEALHPGKATPLTYDRGTKTIDHMFGSLQVRNSMTRGGYLPFYHFIQAYHRGMYIDFDASWLFGGVQEKGHRLVIELLYLPIQS
jgi:hypothetical protein